MEAATDGPNGAASADTPSTSPKQEQPEQPAQLRLLRSACRSVASGAGAGPGPPPMSRRPNPPDAGDDADAFFEYDLEEGGGATAAAAAVGGGSGTGGGGSGTGGGGSGTGGASGTGGTGGADTGYAVTSPAEGTPSTSPVSQSQSQPRPPSPPGVRPLLPAAPPERAAGTPATPSASAAQPPPPLPTPPSAEPISPLPTQPSAQPIPPLPLPTPPSAEPIPIPGSSTGAYTRRQSSEATFRTPAAEAAAARPVAVSPHVQQSPNERVGAWLRACASDSSTTDAEDEYGTPEANLQPQFDIDLGSPLDDSNATLEAAREAEAPEVGEAAAPDETAEIERFLSTQCIANNEPSSASNLDTCVGAVGGERLAHARDSIVVYSLHHEHDHEHSSAAASVEDSAAGAAVAVAAEPVEVVDVVDPAVAGPPDREAEIPAGDEVEVVDVVGMVPREDAPADAEGAAAAPDADADADAEADADGSAGAHSSDAVPPDMLKRSCSLKSGKTPPSTPGRKKFVRFADAMGLDLQRVHMFRDEIPNVPAAAFRGLNMTETPGSAAPQPTTFQMSFSSTNLSSPVGASGGAALAGPATAAAATSPEGPHLVPMFLQPGGSRNFTDQLHRNRVRLETVVCRDGEWTVRGVVRVLNMDFNKSVMVRYTTDNWATHREVEATYVPGSCDGLSDRFSFRLDAHGLPPGGQLQFAVCFHCRGETFWDNNDGHNYVVQLHHVGPSLPSMAYSPPSDWAGGRY